MSKATTRLVALLGSPVSHSLSPRVHTAALDACAIDARYLAFDVAPRNLKSAVEGLRALNAVGANVTVPHKVAAAPLLDELEPVAREAGAVNTIVCEGERLVGTNTDVAGLVRSLRDSSVELSGARVVIVGAGGAARASAVAMRQMGAAEIVVAARRVAQAQAWVSSIGARAIALDSVDLGGVALFVQATSATLRDPASASAFAESLSLEQLPKESAVIDLVYAPRQTAVLTRARALGLAAIEGNGMLVHQAAVAFERWFGVDAPLEAMRAAIG